MDFQVIIQVHKTLLEKFELHNQLNIMVDDNCAFDADVFNGLLPNKCTLQHRKQYEGASFYVLKFSKFYSTSRIVQILKKYLDDNKIKFTKE